MENANSSINFSKTKTSLDIDDITKNIASYLTDNVSIFQKLIITKKNYSQLILEFLFSYPSYDNKNLIEQKLLNWMKNPHLLLKNKERTLRLLTMLRNSIRNLPWGLIINNNTTILATACLAYISTPIESRNLIHELFIEKIFSGEQSDSELAKNCIGWLNDTSKISLIEKQVKRFALGRKAQAVEIINLDSVEIESLKQDHPYLFETKTGQLRSNALAYFKENEKVYFNLIKRADCQNLLSYIKLLLPLINKTVNDDSSDFSLTEGLKVIEFLLEDIKYRYPDVQSIVKIINNTFSSIIYSILRKDIKKEITKKALDIIDEMLQLNFIFSQEILETICQKAIEHSHLELLPKLIINLEKSSPMVAECFEHIEKIIEKNSGSFNPEIFLSLLEANLLVEKISTFITKIINNPLVFPYYTPFVKVLPELLIVKPEFSEKCLDVLAELLEEDCEPSIYKYVINAIYAILKIDNTFAAESFKLFKKLLQKDIDCYISDHCKIKNIILALFEVDIKFAVKCINIFKKLLQPNYSLYNCKILLLIIPDLLNVNNEFSQVCINFLEKLFLEDITEYYLKELKTVVVSLLQLDSKFAEKCLCLFTTDSVDATLLLIPELLKFDANLAERCYTIIEYFIKEKIDRLYSRRSELLCTIEALYEIDMNYYVRIKEVLDIKDNHIMLYQALILSTIPVLLQVEPELIKVHYQSVEIALIQSSNDSGLFDLNDYYLLKSIIAILKADKNFSEPIWKLILFYTKDADFFNICILNIWKYLSVDVIQTIIKERLIFQFENTEIMFIKQVKILNTLFYEKQSYKKIDDQVQHIINIYNKAELIAIMPDEHLHLLHLLINLTVIPSLSEMEQLDNAIEKFKSIYPDICKSAICRFNMIKYAAGTSYKPNNEWRCIDGQVFSGPINLRGINLTRVDLTGVDLTGVDLTGADFKDAACSNVKFNGADLNDVSFCGTEITNAIFENCININSAKAKTLSVLKEQILQASQPAELAEIKQKNSNGFLALHQNKVAGFFGLNANSKKEFLIAIEQREECLQQKITEQTEKSSSVNGPK